MSGVQVPEKVKLGIRSQDGNVSRYLVPNDWALEKLFKHHCNHKDLDYNSLTFLHDGDRVHPNQSAARLHLKDDDVIDAMANALGGGCGISQVGLGK